MLNDAALLSQLTLIGSVNAANLTGALSSVVIERTIDGASTVTMTCIDHRRTLLRSGVLAERAWCVVDGLNYELVKVSKATDILTLTYEDAVVAALRRRKGTRTWSAGTVSRAQIAADMAGEVPVAVNVDPAVTAKVTADVVRSKEGQDPTDSWSVLGSLASDVDLRRFSDGQRLIFGSDAWLTTRYPATTVSENSGPAQNVDFDIDLGQDSVTATLTVDADRFATPPGQGIDVTNFGLAGGRWLVSKVSRTLTRARATVDLARVQDPLPEPDDDAGDFDFLPGATTVQPVSTAVAAHGEGGGGDLAVGAASTPAREKMIAFAMKQAGKPYVWGASGPSGFDCSGLVQSATAAIGPGKALSKPARAQWTQLQAKGKVISVAEGLATRGAILVRINSGDTDHIVISLGDGTTVEARGKAYGCGVFPGAASRHWTGAAIYG